MVSFDKFVSDLQEESLLDEKIEHRNEEPCLDAEDEIEKSFNANLEEEGFIKIDRQPRLPENPPGQTSPEPPQEVSTANAQTLTKTRRIKSKKSGKSRKHCPTCLIRLPKFSIRCKFCHRRVVGNFTIFVLTLLVISIAAALVAAAILLRP